MFTEQQLPNHIALNLTARFLFTSLFLLSGITHFTNVPYYQSLMPDFIPFQLLLIYVSGIAELIGATMVLCNYRPRLGGWLLIVFLLPVTVLIHGYEMVYEQDQVIRDLQQAHFLKGFALIGSAMLITQLGVSHRPAPKPQ